jgi:hypothetical protein
VVTQRPRLSGADVVGNRSPGHQQLLSQCGFAGGPHAVNNDSSAVGPATEAPQPDAVIV